MNTPHSSLMQLIGCSRWLYPAGQPRLDFTGLPCVCLGAGSRNLLYLFYCSLLSMFTSGTLITTASCILLHASSCMAFFLYFFPLPFFVFISPVWFSCSSFSTPFFLRAANDGGNKKVGVGVSFFMGFRVGLHDCFFSLSKQRASGLLPCHIRLGWIGGGGPSISLYLFRFCAC